MFQPIIDVANSHLYKLNIFKIDKNNRFPFLCFKIVSCNRNFEKNNLELSLFDEYHYIKYILPPLCRPYKPCPLTDALIVLIMRKYSTQEYMLISHQCNMPWWLIQSAEIRALRWHRSTLVYFILSNNLEYNDND